MTILSGRWLTGGLLAGLVLALAGFGLRELGVGYPVEGIFARLTHLLGVPAVLNLLHRVLGFSELAKLLAFGGAFAGWLVLHALLLRAYGAAGALALVPAFAFYAFFGGWAAGIVYTLLLWAAAGWVWLEEDVPDLGRRQAVRRLAAGVLALGVLGGAAGAMAGALRRQRARTGVALRDVFETARDSVSAGWERIRGLAREITPQSELYYVSKNPSLLDPKLMGNEYRLEINGLVEAPFTLTLDQLRALPARELINTMTCISNPIGGRLIGCAVWTGVPLTVLLERARPRRDADWLTWHAADDFTESLPLRELPANALIAYAINGEDFQGRHGYPSRLLLPGRYGMKQPKWVTRITLAAREEPGYWAKRFWSRSAVIRTMSRIDTPKKDARVRVLRQTVVAGVAFAGGRTLEAVHVSSDDGRSWTPALLKPPLAPFAWQLWAYAWTPARAGSHTLVVRAVEAGGLVQDDKERKPLPDGATGYHKVRVTVEG